MGQSISKGVSEIAFTLNYIEHNIRHSKTIAVISSVTFKYLRTCICLSGTCQQCQQQFAIATAEIQYFYGKYI